MKGHHPQARAIDMRRSLLLFLVWLVISSRAFADGDHKDAFGDPLPKGAVARLGSIRFRHEGAVNDVAFAPDGKSIFSGSADRTIRQWDLKTGKAIRQFRPTLKHNPSDGVRKIAISPDGKTLYAATGIITGKDRSLWAWDLKTGKLLYAKANGHRASGLLVAHPDGKRLISCGSGDVCSWDAATGKLLPLSWKCSSRHAFALSKDGKRIAHQSRTYSLHISDASTGKVLKEFGQVRSEVRGMSFSPDGKLLAEARGTLRVWDATKGEQLKHFDGISIHACAFSPDGKWLAGASSPSNKIYLWRVSNWKKLRVWRVASGPVNSIAFSPGSKLLAAGTGSWGVHLFDVTTGKALHTKFGHTGSVHALDVSPDGKTIITASDDQTVRLWKLATGKQLRQTKVQHRIPALSFLQDGKRFVAGHYRRPFSIWDVARFREAQDLKIPSPIRKRLGRSSSGWRTGACIDVSPDGNTIVVGTAVGEIFHWNLVTGEIKRSVLGRRKKVALPPFFSYGQIECIKFSPDGKRCVTGGQDQPARLIVMNSQPPWVYRLTVWESATTRKVYEKKSSGLSHRIRIRGDWRRYCLAYSPDGKTMAYGDPSGYVRLIEPFTGKTKGSVSAPQDGLVSVAFSPDGKRLATGSAKSGKVRLWDVSTGKIAHELDAGRGPTFPVVFSRDGRFLVSGTGGRSPLVWRMPKRK